MSTKLPNDTKRNVDQAWDAVGSHLFQIGFKKQSKLRRVKRLSKSIDHFVIASRYKLRARIILDIGLAVRCYPLEDIFQAKISGLDKYFFTNVTSLVHLLNASGCERSQEDYGVTDSAGVAELICRDFDNYAGRFFDPQTDMLGLLNYLESNPFLTGSTTRRASIAGLAFLMGQFDKARKIIDDSSFGGDHVFEEAIRQHILESG